MAKGILTCYHCQQSFRFYSAHAGFGDEIFFYCKTCDMVACVDIYREEARQFYQKHGLTQPYQQSEHDLFTARFHQMKEDIARHLAPCSCGGLFTTATIRRCPHCRKPLDWEKVVDGIDQQSDSTIPHYFRRNVKRRWRDIYYFVFNDRLIRNSWKIV